MKKTIAAGIAAAAIGLASLGIGIGITANQPAPVAEQTVERATTVNELEPTRDPEPIATPTETAMPEPVVEAPAPPPAPEIVKCPSGTTAGQVDAAGNESNCQPTNNGQPCVEYNDQNVCTRWYQP